MNRGLFFEYVEARPPDNAVTERLCERGFIYNRSTRGVEQDRVSLHTPKFTGAQEVVRIGGQWTMHAHDVGPLEERAQLDLLNPKSRTRLPCDGRPIVHHDLHPKPRRPPGDRPADPTKADDPQGAAM